MSLPKEQPPFKMSQKYIVDIPTDGQMTVPFFSVVVCNLIKEPAKKHSNKRAKQSKFMEPPNIATNGQMTVPFFFGRNLIEEPAKTI